MRDPRTSRNQAGSRLPLLALVADIAAIARGLGCEAVTVRSSDDLGPVREWVDGPRERPLLIDAKITSFPSWVLAHTFQAEK